MAETLYGLDIEIREITSRDDGWLEERRSRLSELGDRAALYGLTRQIEISKILQTRLDFEAFAREREQMSGIVETGWNTVVPDIYVDQHDEL